MGLRGLVMSESMREKGMGGRELVLRFARVSLVRRLWILLLSFYVGFVIFCLINRDPDTENNILRRHQATISFKATFATSTNKTTRKDTPKINSSTRPLLPKG
jgi:hypothetical protein